jgi:hypothetical protein
MYYFYVWVSFLAELEDIYLKKVRRIALDSS